MYICMDIYIYTVYIYIYILYIYTVYIYIYTQYIYIYILYIYNIWIHMVYIYMACIYIIIVRNQLRQLGGPTLFYVLIHQMGKQKPIPSCIIWCQTSTDFQIPIVKWSHLYRPAPYTYIITWFTLLNQKKQQFEGPFLPQPRRTRGTSRSSPRCWTKWSGWDNDAWSMTKTVLGVPKLCSSHFPALKTYQH